MVVSRKVLLFVKITAATIDGTGSVGDNSLCIVYWRRVNMILPSAISIFQEHDVYDFLAM